MFLKCGIIFLSLVAAGEWQDELDKINGQIIQLEEMQEKLRSRAKRNAQDAMQWQFQGENHRDARRAWEKASQEKQKLDEIQGHLDTLRLRKQKILQEHGER